MHDPNCPVALLSHVLRREAKTGTHKFALLRATAEVARTFPDLADHDRHVAVPLDTLAEYFIAYYWPFARPSRPLNQASRGTKPDGTHKSDIAFRPQLVDLIREWQAVSESAYDPSDGYRLVAMFRAFPAPYGLPTSVIDAYGAALDAAAVTIQSNPAKNIRRIERDIFQRVCRREDISHPVTDLPGTTPDERCLLVCPGPWAVFQQHSVWVEALSVHEWCLFTEKLSHPGDCRVTREQVYELFTARSDNRLAPTWAANRDDILRLERKHFGRSLA
ncbi:MAG: hypothetical protein GX537_10735 [Actinobacteria bacterium]|nr:hypothetical protein [Actinomycetota bacterium]